MKNVTKHLHITSLKTEGDGLQDRQFSGYASVFGNKDAHNDVIMKGAYATALANKNYPTAMHFNHDTFQVPVGKWLEMHEDDHGLFVKGELTPGLAAADDLHAAMKHGTVDGMSVGFSMGKDDYEDNDQGGWNIKNIPELREISLTPRPANTSAKVTSLKSIENIASIREAEKTLRDAGFSKSEATAFISRLTSLKTSGDPGPEDDDLQEMAKLFNDFSFIHKG